jgi:hypothetical protein
VFVKEAIGWQVKLSVYMAQLSVLEIHRGIEEAMIGGLLDQSDDDGHPSARSLQQIEPRIPRRECHGRDHVLEKIPGQGKFRKKEKIHALSLGLTEELVVEGEVFVQVPEDR